MGGSALSVGSGEKREAKMGSERWSISLWDLGADGREEKKRSTKEKEEKEKKEEKGRRRKKERSKEKEKG